MPRPNGRDPQADPATFLGARLQRARIAAGFGSQEALANALGFDRSTITKTENGSRPPTDDVFTKWCDTCNVTDELRDVLAGLLVVARRTDGPVPAWFKDYLEAEGDALTLRIWQPLIVPGLLQIPAYAHALFVAAGADGDKADEMVTARMSRQSIFERSKPPNISVVLDEPVLHRLIGSPQIMHDQLVHIVEASQRPHVMIQLVPAANGANAGLGGRSTLPAATGRLMCC